LGGAQEYYGVKPDMATLGKIPGGGLPLGAFGGRREIMDRTVTPTGDKDVDIQTKVFSSGTFSGNPLTMAAGLAVIVELEKGKVYPHINRLGEMMRTGLADIGSKLNVDLQPTGAGSIFHIYFTSNPIRNRRDALRADAAKLIEFHRRWLVKGAFIPPGHIGMTSAAHTEEDIRKTLTWSEEALKEMKREKLA
jgi:glutamate-1-semialdehyde 2,1-aminomutase